MPIYEYACQNCDHTLDSLQKMSDAPLVDCPECGEPQLKRLLSAPRFRLKGAGWYETDFKKDNQKNVHKSDSEPVEKDSKSDTKSDGKADKKDTKKTETKAKAASKNDSQ